MHSLMGGLVPSCKGRLNWHGMVSIPIQMYRYGRLHGQVMDHPWLALVKPFFFAYSVTAHYAPSNKNGFNYPSHTPSSPHRCARLSVRSEPTLR